MSPLKKKFLSAYPLLYISLRRVWHRFREIMERHVIGTRFQEWIWQTRHLYDYDLAGFSISSVNHPHRDQIVNSITLFLPISSILEVGCGWGANLLRLREQFPNVDLHGVDINGKAITVVREHFDRLGQKSVFLREGRANCLNFYADKSIDVVLCDAVLMFLAPDKIRETLAEMGRVARNSIILNEYHLAGAMGGHYEGGRWVYDIINLYKELYPNLKYTITKSTYTGGNWDRFGTFIIIHL